MKHTAADIVTEYLKLAAVAILNGWSFHTNFKPAEPAKIVVVTDDPFTSLKASRDARTGEPTIFHGVQILLQDISQTAAAAAGNRLQTLIDGAKRSQVQSIVELPDPESTEDEPLPNVRYLIHNLSRPYGIALERDPKTGKWMFMTSIRASIGDAPPVP